MLLNRSPPNAKKPAGSTTAGGSMGSSGHGSLTSLSSTSPLLSGGSSTCRTSGSSLSLYSNLATAGLIADGPRTSVRNSSQSAGAGFKSSNHHYHQQSNQQKHHYGGSGGRSSGSSSSTSASSKRGKKTNWGSRERAGMSFLIVIAFFAVFGLIILTELFMIDEKSHGGMIVLRHGNLGNRLGDSMPDYDNVKDDYDLLDDSLLSDNKLGFVQFHDNKLKIQDASSADGGRMAGVLLNSPANGYGTGAGAGAGAGNGGGFGIGGGVGGNVPIIPWGKVLPAKIEETLPHYPIGMTPTDGSWQVVNGTRFKFFVFSAYYDRRDGAKLVRVVGATKTRGPERVWCRFWYAATQNGTKETRYSSATVMARVKIIRENWNLKYSACFVLCPIRTPELEVPRHVSIVARLRAPPGNFLHLRNTDWDPDFAVNRSAVAASASASHGGSTSRSISGPPHPSSSASASASAYSSLSSSASLSLSLSSSSWSGLSPVPTGEQIADKIAICVKPFHFNYDQALYLMEYLEFYALMGVSHFTFYNHTTGPHATCVLEHYMRGDVPDSSTAYDEEPDPMSLNSAASFQQQQQHPQPSRQQQQQQQGAEKPATKRRISTNYVKPTINILPWNLRMRSQKEIRTEGLFAALNDCLYRTMYRYKYLALVDLDEFIIPRHNDTLNELINSLNQRFRNRNNGAYSFQNAFFYLQFADDPLVYQEPEKSLNPQLRAALVSQRKTRRRYKLHPQKQRSKYICKPEAVIEAGNHFVWEFSPGKGSLNVPPTDAILHHYRVCEFGGNDCIKAPSTVDRTATKYANRLLQRVDAVYNYLKKPCDLPDLPALPKQPPPMPQSDQPAKPTARATITKIFNDFKTKLKETIKSNTNTNTNANTNTIANTKTKTNVHTNNEHMTNATRSTRSEKSAAKAKDYDYEGGRKRQHKLVIFEEDNKGRTVVKVKYVNP